MILATDLDGTLIPLAGNEQNRCDLRTLAEELQEHGIPLVFVTGRHFESVLDAIEQSSLPTPQWIICDVGTSIFQNCDDEYRLVDHYRAHQDQIVAAMPIGELQNRLAAIVGLRLQEPVKQGRFKLSYYVDADEIDRLTKFVQEVLDETESPYSIIHSVDPFNGDGLIDLLPARVSKSYAIAWWLSHLGLDPEAIVFAGDSGNDFAALTAGYRAIVVGNADRTLAQQVVQAHQHAGWTNRLYVARNPATSGVLQGCRWFRSVS